MLVQSRFMRNILLLGVKKLFCFQSNLFMLECMKFEWNKLNCLDCTGLLINYLVWLWFELFSSFWFCYQILVEIWIYQDEIRFVCNVYIPITYIRWKSVKLNFIPPWLSRKYININSWIPSPALLAKMFYAIALPIQYCVLRALKPYRKKNN